jgi:monoamine oxidase
MANLRVAARPDPGTPGRVVVVGAGLAGLTAALTLRDAGWEVLVVEARDRVGGRVHTRHGGVDGVPLAPGLRAEMGGESIDENHTEIQRLARRFEIATEPRPGSTSDRAANGRYHRDEHTFSFADLMNLRGGSVLSDYLRVYDELAKAAELCGIDPEQPETARHADDLDAQSLAEWLDSLLLVPEARFVVDQANTSLYNAELTDLSMLFVLQQVAATAGVPDAWSETMRLAGGNSTLPNAIADELGPAVVLDSPLTAVLRRGEVVTVVAGGREHVAAHVVLAVPPPPLRDVQFDPPVPPAIATAIAGLDLGAATKVVNQFDTAFWRAGGESGFSLTDLTYRVSWDASDSYAAAGGLLTTYTTAGNGRVLAAMSDAARIARVRDELAIVYPHSRAQLSGPAITRAWTQEPFTRGGYAVYGPGQVGACWETLRAGTDRIHFAGEHLEAPAGYMESAVRSGLRVAARLGSPK